MAVVYAYSRSLDPGDVSVVSDDVASGALAAEHLLALGRSRIAYLGGAPDYIAAQDRSAGVTAALHRAGLTPALEPMFGAWSEEWGRAGAKAILDRAPRTDAIICGNDQIARGAVDALRDLGVAVPASIAVIGHDNWEPIAAHSQPPLTSIDMRLETLGKRAAELLFTPERDRDSNVHIVPSRVVARSTTL